MQVVTITSEAEFASLAPAWNALAARTLVPSLFLSHDWFAAAWAWRRLDSTLHLKIAHDRERIAGILPLICKENLRSRSRRLEFLAVPDTQVCDLIAAQADLPGVSDMLAADLAMRDDWDVLQLDYFSPNGALFSQWLPAMGRRGFRIHERAGGPSPYIALDDHWDQYYGGRSRRLKKANNLAANRLKKSGAVRIEWLTPQTHGEAALERALDAVIDVSRRSWKRETVYSLDQSGPQAFIRALSRVALRRGWLSMWLAFVDDRPIAMEYQLVDDGHVYALRADFDAGYEEVSPGTHLFRHLLELLFGRGFKRYHLGHGNNPYKQRWTDAADPLRCADVYNRTMRGRLSWLREAVLKPRLGHLRDRLPFDKAATRSARRAETGAES